MNTLFKTIASGFVGILMMANLANAQVEESAPVAVKGNADCITFQTNQACYDPSTGVVVLVDSIDNCVDVLVRNNSEMVLKGHYLVEEFRGRHDLLNVLRPKDLHIVDGNIVVVASSMKDSSQVLVLDMDGKLIKMMGFSSCTYGINYDENTKELVLMGKNPLGYDVNFISFADGVSNMKVSTSHHYRVPKQSDRIKESDPWGIGVSGTSLAVVFIALLIVTVVLIGYSGAIKKFLSRKGRGKVVDKDDEIYAAISTAIFLYNEELHDQETPVITFNKVERAWTPWNAKFYSMTRYKH